MSIYKKTSIFLLDKSIEKINVCKFLKKHVQICNKLIEIPDELRQYMGKYGQNYPEEERLRATYDDWNVDTKSGWNRLSWKKNIGERGGWPGNKSPSRRLCADGYDHTYSGATYPYSAIDCINFYIDSQGINHGISQKGFDHNFTLHSNNTINFVCFLHYPR